jgi:hypothetical protein
MRILSVLGLWLWIMTGSAGLAQSGASPAGDSKAASISVSVYSPRTDITLGSAIPLELTVTNISAQDIQLSIPRDAIPEVHYSVDFRRADGQPVPITDLYRDMRVPVTGNGDTLRLLGPGQSFRQDVILNYLYKLDVPGNYTARLFWLDPVTKAVVSSNQVSLTVNPASAAEQAKMTGAVTHSFSLTLRAREYRVRAGSEVRVQVTLVNPSDHEIALPQAAPGKPEFDYRVSVYDEWGNSPKETDYVKTAEQMRAASSSTKALVTVPAKKTLNSEIVVSDLYDFSRPGRYSVVVSRRDQAGSWFMVESNSVAIVVE